MAQVILTPMYTTFKSDLLEVLPRQDFSWAVLPDHMASNACNLMWSGYSYFFKYVIETMPQK